MSIESKLEFNGNQYLEAITIEKNGIQFNASSEEQIEELVSFCKEVEENFKFKIDSQSVSIISLGKLPIQEASAAFDPDFKMLKLVNLSYRNKTVFIHEYCHALDFHYDIYKEFIDSYKEAVKENNREVFENSEHIKYYTDLSDEEVLKAMRSMDISLYMIWNIREYVACSLSGKFFDFNLKKELQEKADQALNKYFYKTEGNDLPVL